jgi:two-component system cell cycle sensor histidine kinase/response regulator CckA
LVERSPLGFLIVQGLSPRVVFANQAAAEMLGCSVDELVSLAPEDVTALVRPEDLSRLLASYRDAREGKRSLIPLETRIIRRDGVERWVELLCSSVPGREDRSVQVYVVDITENKCSQREQGEEIHGRERVQKEKGVPKGAQEKEPQAQLLQTEKLRAVEALAGEVAHDFNELLISVQERIDLALRKIDQRSPLYRDLKSIEDASMGAANLVRQLLLFGGRQPMEFITINLNKTVKILSKMLTRLIGKDIALITRLEPDLWSVKADMGSIEQVIVNLAMNARDAMPEGGELGIQTKNVDLHENSCGDIPDARPGKFACLSVTDTGIGMGETTRSRIFEPFFSTKRQQGNAGLGLSVAYGIVKQHKGWIDVHSETGKGTSFKVYLPALIVKDETDSDTKGETRQAQGSGQRILLVDNEDAVREFVARELDEEGYVVFEAPTAEEALEIFERERGNFHLVLTDIVLPNKNGLQLVDQLRSRRPELPILLSSSHAAEKSRWPAIRKRGFRFLTKPFTSAELFLAIREIIGQTE